MRGPRSDLERFSEFFRNFRDRQFRDIVRPEKWDDSQVGFRGGNASDGRTVLLPGAFCTTLGTSLLLCILKCFRA